MISKCSNDNNDSMLRLVLNVIMAMLNNSQLYLHKSCVSKVFKILVHIQCIAKSTQFIQ